MCDTYEGDENYENFMVSDDEESLQVEFESDSEEQVNVDGNGKDDAAITKLLSSSEELMNAGRWNDARVQLTKVLANAIEQQPFDILPVWMKIMTCWTRILRYYDGRLGDLLDQNDLFIQCSQFCDYLLRNNCSVDGSRILPFLQRLIIDLFPDLTNRYMFELREVSEMDKTRLLNKINLRSRLYTIFKCLPTWIADEQVQEFLELQSLILSHWKRLISTGLIRPDTDNDISQLIDYGSLDSLITALLNESESSNEKISKEKTLEQRIIIQRYELIFQIFTLSYFLNGKTIINDIFEIKLDRILQIFQRYSNDLLTVSQDSKIMLLYHLSYSIQLIINIPQMRAPHKSMLLCRDQFLSSLRHLEILGSYSQWQRNGHCQYILIGFILVSVFIILQEKYIDNREQLYGDTLLDPFEYEEVKIIGKTAQCEEVIKRLQKNCIKIIRLTDLQESYYELQNILSGLSHGKIFEKYRIIIEEMFNIAVKSKLLYKIVPLYERISIEDLQNLLTYDPKGYPLSKDDIIQLLMEFKLDEGLERRKKLSSFSIDFIEDHVLFDEETREVFADNNITDTFERKQEIDNFFNSIKEVSDIAMKDDGTNEDNYQQSLNSKTQSFEELMQLQLQAAQLISESLSSSTSI